MFTLSQLKILEGKDMEVWLPISEVEGYEASNTGFIRSLGREIIRPEKGNYWKEGRILKPHELKPIPYLRVGTTNLVGETRNYLVHRLVAMAFLENPNNLPDVDHKNKDPQDNRVLNLQWMTRSDHLDKDQALEYDFISPEGQEVTIRNMNSFCRENNLSAGNMSEVFHGRRKQHKGWRKP